MAFLLLVSVLFEDPLPSLQWWAVSVGRNELKWRQLTHNQLMNPQGPHFSPHSTAKTNDKSTNLRKNASIAISDVVTASVYSEITRLKKLMMIMNKSQEMTVFHGRQKLTSVMKLRPEK